MSFYSVEHLTANNFTKTKYIEESVFLKENKRVILEKSDVLMTRIGDIGTIKYINLDVIASFYVSLALIKHKDDFFNSESLSLCMNTEFFQKELWNRTIHVVFPKKINLGEIGLCKIFLPHLDEQKQIADFLSAIDHQIALLSHQINQTEQYKK